MKKRRIYIIGTESTIVAGRPYYRGSYSSSTEWEQRQELEELRKEMGEVRSERDELWNRIANVQSTLEPNNQWIQALMDNMNRQSMPYSIKETEDETQPSDA